MKKTVRTRIPPSPTGKDLHMGNAFTALINSVVATKYKGQFIIRIEDTDRMRFVEGAEAKILESLHWLGIPYDEGPDIGGPHAPYRQSERLPIFKKYAEELVTKGHAYYCFCTPDRLSKMRAEQEAKHQPPMYDGLCKAIEPNKARELAQTNTYVIRLDVPDAGETKYTDAVRGEISFQNQLIDDQVLLKSDGFPTYHLGVVVDDHLMEVSHVIRGEEWISSTPKQILLYTYLGWELPVFAHVPVLRNPDKSKLSKRKNAVWVSWYREQGFLPEAILNYLGTLTWSMPDGRDIFTVDEMITHFNISKIKTTAPIFDIEKFKWLNGEYIRKMKQEELAKRLKEFLPSNIDEHLIGQLAPLAQTRMKTLIEFSEYLKQFTHFERPHLTQDEKEIVKKFLTLYTQRLTWDRAKLEEKSKALVTEQKWKLRDALLAVRVAVTGTKIGLPLFETLEILGKDEVCKRLELSLG